MNSKSRVLTLIGAGLLAGAAIGTGPASAAPSTGAATVTPSTIQLQQPPYDDDDDVVGYFRTRWACERAGRVGEWRDRWEDYDCERVRWGFRRGMWQLEVDRGWDWNNGHGNNDDDYDNDEDHGHGHGGGGHH